VREYVRVSGVVTCCTRSQSEQKESKTNEGWKRGERVRWIYVGPADWDEVSGWEKSAAAESNQGMNGYPFFRLLVLEKSSVILSLKGRITAE